MTQIWYKPPYTGPELIRHTGELWYRVSPDGRRVERADLDGQWCGSVAFRYDVTNFLGWANREFIPVSAVGERVHQTPPELRMDIGL